MAVKPLGHTSIISAKDAPSFYSKLESNKDKKVDIKIIEQIKEQAQFIKNLLKSSK